MLDISFGEFVFLVAASSWLIGRNDLPKATKIGGQALGRAIGYMMRVRQTVEELSVGSNDLNAMRQDMQKGYEEFNRVSMEVRNVGRIGGLATAGMYGGVGGMARHAVADMTLNGGGPELPPAAAATSIPAQQPFVGE
jgi:hypothetical protein